MNFDSTRFQCLHLGFHCQEFPTSASYFQIMVSTGPLQKGLFYTNSDCHAVCLYISLRPNHNCLNLVFAGQDVDWLLLLAALELLF